MRKPARLERAGALTPRDRLWAAMRRFRCGEPFSVAEIMLLAGVRGDEALDLGGAARADSTIDYIRGLTAAGILEDAGARPIDRPVRELRWFRLVKDVGVEAPRVDKQGRPVTQGIGCAQMWRAMRALKGEFGARELSIAASTEAHVVEHATAKRYARELARAGYLQVTKESAGGRGAERLYRFVKSRYTGPRAPMITAQKQVMDGNTGEIVYDPKKADQ
jgi:hypothetical protein